MPTSDLGCYITGIEFVWDIRDIISTNAAFAFDKAGVQELPLLPTGSSGPVEAGLASNLSTSPGPQSLPSALTDVGFR